jgi:Asp-tRNA(Asn)/Glu-tRNA(Gln) amidotransferase A subunit family amidase
MWGRVSTLHSALLRGDVVLADVRAAASAAADKISGLNAIVTRCEGDDGNAADHNPVAVVDEELLKRHPLYGVPIAVKVRIRV